MVVHRWNPPAETTPQEESLLARLGRTRKLYAFLRRHRHELFDEVFQNELAEMYRDTGAGKAPVSPAFMAMVTLLQGYYGASDAEAVELTVVDRRWQLVLDCWGADEPACSQGCLQAFRERLIAHDMDRRLLERTIELARTTGEFDWKKLPKNLRVAADSSPLDGAARVEDTFNLLGRAARGLVTLLAEIMESSPGELADWAGIPLAVASSIKRGLDIDWNDESAKSTALNRLTAEIESLETWLCGLCEDVSWLDESTAEHLERELDQLDRLREQNLEQVPEEPEKVRVAERVAPDRQITIHDPEMRHGRKSSSKRVDGYKRHIVGDLDTGLIVACAVTPANKPEAEALEEMERDLARQGAQIGELQIDRAYITSPTVQAVIESGGEVVCRPWVPRNRHAEFTKADFQIDLEKMTITCPGEQSRPITKLGARVQFLTEKCTACALRSRCTNQKDGRGRSIHVAEDEPLQQDLQRYVATSEGRARLRDRVAIEHSLAHIGARQGPKARYCGVRKNVFDLRRAASIQNLESIQRSLGEGEYRNAA